MNMGARTGMVLCWVEGTRYAFYFYLCVCVFVGSFILLTSIHPYDATPGQKFLATIKSHGQIYHCYSATDLLGYKISRLHLRQSTFPYALGYKVPFCNALHCVRVLTFLESFQQKCNQGVREVFPLPKLSKHGPCCTERTALISRQPHPTANERAH